MDSSLVAALAALAGATIGGLTSIGASLLSQRMQAHAQWIVQERLRRQELYKEFIEEAAKCQVHALQNDKADIAALALLYSKIGRMHVVSSPKVVDSAEQVGRKIIDAYLQPNKTFPELREMVENNSIHIIHDFSMACREELDVLRV
jgi:hypothetical protein